jgi:Na+/citrate or Na+/malate symporter
MINDSLKNPLIAALVGAVLTMAYIQLVARLNREAPPSNADMIKPAILNAILVGSIVFFGISQREEIYETPFPEVNRGI